MTLSESQIARASIWLSLVICSPSLAAEGKIQERASLSAEALVADADPNSSIFRVNPAGGVIHVQSGMSCVLGSKDLSLTKLIIVSGAKPGDDVACDYATPSGKTTIFATRLNGRNLSTVAADIFEAMKATYPNAKLIDGPLVASYPKLRDPITASIEISGPDGKLVSSAWISEDQGWIVEVRATYPATDRHDPELFAAISSVNARISINKQANQAR